MDSSEEIQAHIVSVWREAKGFFSIGGKEGMLVLTNKHLMFIHKTKAKMKWWQAVVPRQVITFLKSKNTMIHHDGYDEDVLIEDLKNEKNVEISFDEILQINHDEKGWGSVLNLEYEKDGKKESYQFSIVQDWVKYPAKDPTKYLRVDWEPFVKYIKDRQKITK